MAIVVRYIEVIKTISSLFIIIIIIIIDEISSTQKHVTSKNQLTKQKQANTKQQRQQFFMRAQTSRCDVFLCTQNHFVKKNEQA